MRALILGRLYLQQRPGQRQTEAIFNITQITRVTLEEQPSSPEMEF